MPRYEHEEAGWWVEIEGAADLMVCELDKVLSGVATEGWPIVEEVLVDSHFTDRHGEEFKLSAEIIEKGEQSLRQWQWVMKRVFASALDEIASGEA